MHVWQRAAGALTLSTLAFSGQFPSAAPPTAGQPTAAVLGQVSDTPARTVTLITGDRVGLVGEAPTGAVEIHPAEGREHLQFIVQRLGPRTVVLPEDVAPLVTSGRLDQRLFDVAELITLGYDDQSRDDLPVIMTDTGLPLSSLGDTEVTVTRFLTSIDGVALSVPKDAAASFWQSAALAWDTPQDGTVPARRQDTTKIWLDGRRQLSLESSVPQIGAPRAWSAGLDGAGVTVAVLDSGIDADHPDLAGRVVASRNFTDEPAGDFSGHGTHVASIIAGTGAASGGRIRGVAPHARLLDGKVCGTRHCSDSAILAAMEWAVAAGADVVNMSLGGADTPELDPLEDAVDRLSSQHGTLFVVAAGNDGRDGGVHSPSTADAALSVAATTRQDTVADFSSRGPRYGDHAVKPDIAAPGVDIVAARSRNGVSPAPDDLYVARSGTSMATPHVAGAAALLVQQHPSWSGERIKAHLMGTSQEVSGGTVYAYGAGRVDVHQSTLHTVTARPASVSFGVQPWPRDDDEPLSRTVTFSNDGAAAVTLNLSAVVTGPDGRPAPPETVTVSASSVTVPAAATASVTVTTRTRHLDEDGVYSGHLVATSAAATVRVPLVVDVEVESYDVTFQHIDSTGAVTGDYIAQISSYHRLWLASPYAADGTVTLRLPKDDYAAFSMIGIADTGKGRTLLSHPSLTLDRDTTVVFDARTAKPIDVQPARDSAELYAGEIFSEAIHDETDWVSGAMTFGLGLTFGPGTTGFDALAAGQVGPPGDPARFHGHVFGRWAERGPAGDFSNSPYSYNLAWDSPGRMFDGLKRHVSDDDLAEVQSRYLAPAQAHIGVDEVWVAPRDIPWRQQWQRANLRFDAPTTRTDYYTTADVRWRRDFTLLSTTNAPPPSVGDWNTSQGTTWTTYEPDTRYVQTWNAGVIGPAFPEPYDPVFFFSRGPSWWTRDEDRIHLMLMPFSGGTAGHAGGSPLDSGSIRLFRNGEELPPGGPDIGAGQWGLVAMHWGDVPPEPADFRVEFDATRIVSDVSTRVTSTWTFRSAAAPMRAIPAMAVRFAPDLDDDYQAGQNRMLSIPVRVESTVPETNVTSLRVEVSYDDGRTWRPAALRRTDDHWTATVSHPGTARYVSLRAVARDSAGSTVEQTIVRAYRTSDAN